MTQAWTSGVERTWKSLSEWVSTPAANWHDCFLPCTGRHSGVSARVQKHTHTCTCEFDFSDTEMLTWLILCQTSSWLAFNQTCSDCHNTDRTSLRHSSPSRVHWPVIRPYSVCIPHSILYMCWWGLCFTDLAVRWDSRDCHMLSRGSRVQKGNALHVSWRNGTDHQQKQPPPGRSLDGWI